MKKGIQMFKLTENNEMNERMEIFSWNNKKENYAL